MRNLNHKRFPAIKWAEPSIMAALQLRRDAGIDAGEIERIEVFTFATASELAITVPKSAEEAQYSLVFPLSVAIVHGDIRGGHLDGAGLDDPNVLRLSRATAIHHDPAYDPKYPAEQTARVRFHLRDGRTMDSQPYVMPGAQEPLRVDEAVAKLHASGADVASPHHLERMERALVALKDAQDLADLDCLFEPISR